LEIPSQQTYQRYEKGLIPSGRVLHTIASKLGVTVDSLLSGGTEAEAVLAGKKVRLEAAETPWGKELEENIQATVFLQLFCRRLNSQQLGQIASDVINNKALTDKAKVYLIKVLSAWLITASELEGFNKLTPREKVARRRAANYQRSADPKAADGAA